MVSHHVGNMAAHENLAGGVSRVVTRERIAGVFGGRGADQNSEQDELSERLYAAMHHGERYGSTPVTTTHSAIILSTSGFMPSTQIS